MPGKMFDDILAAAIVASGEKHYCPSNGTEADYFDDFWCSECERDSSYRENDDETVRGCPILAAALTFDVDDPDYPPEWTYDAKGQPRCTAFRKIKGKAKIYCSECAAKKKEE